MSKSSLGDMKKAQKVHSREGGQHVGMPRGRVTHSGDASRHDVRTRRQPVERPV